MRVRGEAEERSGDRGAGWARYEGEGEDGGKCFEGEGAGARARVGTGAARARGRAGGDEGEAEAEAECRERGAGRARDYKRASARTSASACAWRVHAHMRAYRAHAQRTLSSRTHIWAQACTLYSYRASASLAGDQVHTTCGACVHAVRHVRAGLRKMNIARGANMRCV